MSRRPDTLLDRGGAAPNPPAPPPVLRRSESGSAPSLLADSDRPSPTAPPAGPGASSGSAEPSLESFEAGTIDPGRFRHRDHVRMAWLTLRRDPLPRALERFPEALRRFARAAGNPQLYHETVTYAYLLVIHERMQQRPEGDTWDGFATAHPDLLIWRPSVLERYYREETLASHLARRVFLMPDRLSSA